MAKIKNEDNTKSLLKELNIKKEDLIEEIKNDIKENLTEEISVRIEYESKNKLEKMEKRIYKYKNGSIIKRNIIILLFFVIIVYETKILYDNNLLFVINDKENKHEINEQLDNETDKIISVGSNEIDNEKDLQWYIENYSYLLNNIETNLVGEEEHYLYKKDHSIESIKNSVKLNMAYQLLDGIKNENGILEIKEEEIKEAYEELFGNIDTYESENFSYNCIQFIYNKELKKYMAIDTTCEEQEEELFRNIKYIYEKDDKLIIEVFVGLINQDGKTLSTIDKKDIYDYCEDNINKLPVYEFIFRKQNDKYYLEKIKKLN